MPDVVDDPQPLAPILPGGPTDELLNSWAWWYSLATKAVAAGQTVSLPNPLPPPPSGPAPGLKVGVAVPPITGASLLEGPGGAYSVERYNTVAYRQSQQQIGVVAAKLNPWQY